MVMLVINVGEDLGVIADISKPLINFFNWNIFPNIGMCMCILCSNDSFFSSQLFLILTTFQNTLHTPQ